MRRVVALVALWLLFAATGVAAGFGAARLLEGPTAPAAPAVAAERAPQAGPTTAAPQPTATATATATATRTGSSPGSGGSTLGIDTVAGYVSATCATGVVRMSASPKPGWEVSELSPPGRMGEAEFEQTRGPGGEVGVNAWCEDGRPEFFVDDSELQPRAND